MALFALIGIDKPNALALRMATREAHLAYWAANPGLARLGGPFLDANSDMAGSLLIIEVEDRATAEALAANDPYVHAGLFARWEVRPWRVTLGQLA
jgi:uncharacterized protein YciI